ncbi:MAG TPA: pyridoxamine 5'-phosphate oxidase [Candidatus Binatia bacterium]|nr:pyridoxamine 5'-phosphate oxidase [Candidatus Binatia bacterium]
MARSRIGKDPIALFHRLFARAVRAKLPLPEAMALATASPGGAPSVRFVLLKAADERGFTFFTDGRSDKGRDLARNPRAALVFYWHAIHKQVRIAGRVERVSPAEADAYWATRPRRSRLAAAASVQSAPIASRNVLAKRWLSLHARYGGREVPRPPEWTGYRVVPDAIEIWTRRAHRLHDRDHFARTRTGWRRRLLQP